MRIMGFHEKNIRHTIPTAVLIGALSLSSLSGCASTDSELPYTIAAGNARNATPKASPRPTPSPTPTPTATALNNPTASVTWKTFTSDDDTISFEYPSTWSVEAAPGSTQLAGDVWTATLLDETGTERAELVISDASETVPAITEELYPTEVVRKESFEPGLLYTVPDQVSFAYQIITYPDRVAGVIGLTMNEYLSENGTLGEYLFNSLKQQPVSQGRYLVSFGSAAVVTPQTDTNPLSFDSVDAARAFTAAPEFALLQRSITSLKITQ